MSTWFGARCPSCASTAVLRCRRFDVFVSRQVDAPR